jgi:hypothetical protein
MCKYKVHRRSGHNTFTGEFMEQKIAHLSTGSSSIISIPPAPSFHLPLHTHGNKYLLAASSYQALTRDALPLLEDVHSFDLRRFWSSTLSLSLATFVEAACSLQRSNMINSAHEEKRKEQFDSRREQ